jgi:hypothetical protein
LTVFTSIYPPLNNYIKNVLEECLDLLKENNLKRVELRVLQDDKILESFIADINEIEISPDYDDIEDEFRMCIHSLENRCKMLNKLAKDSRFKIFLHSTSQKSLANDLKSDNLLWIRDMQELPENSEILPIVMTSNSNLIQLYVEKFETK